MGALQVGAGSTAPRGQRLRGVAVVVSLLLAGLYGLLFADVLSVAGAEDAGRGILGVAAGVLVAAAALLWWVRKPAVWVGVGLLQLLMAVMYLGASTGRDPAFEVWGLTARALSLVLLAVLVSLLVATRQARRARS